MDGSRTESAVAGRVPAPRSPRSCHDHRVRCHRRPRGPEGSRRRRDRARRRPRPRGLLPLPPVLRGRARAAARPRGRVAPDVRGSAARPGRARRPGPRGGGRAAPARRGPRRAAGHRRAPAGGRWTGSVRRCRCSAAPAGWRRCTTSTPAQRRQDALGLAAAVPTILAALHRLGRGEQPLEPRDDLGHAAAYLAMLTGEEPVAAACAGRRAVPHARPSTTGSTPRPSPPG